MLLWASQDSDRPSVLFIPVNTPTLVPNQSQICALLNKGFKGKTIKNLLNISTLKPGLSRLLSCFWTSIHAHSAAEENRHGLNNRVPLVWNQEQEESSGLIS